MRTSIRAITLLVSAMAVNTVYANDDSKTDAQDAELTSKISDSSMAITSQNPYIQSIMQKTTHIKLERLKELLSQKDIVFLDIRPRSEFSKNKGITENTMNIPRNFLEVEAYEKIPKKDTAIVVLSSKGIRGGLGAHTLQEMGYTNVRNLLGGLQSWSAAAKTN